MDLELFFCQLLMPSEKIGFECLSLFRPAWLPLQPQPSLVQLEGAAGGGGEQGSAHGGSTQATAEGVRPVGFASPHCPVNSFVLSSLVNH